MSDEIQKKELKVVFDGTRPSAFVKDSKASHDDKVVYQCKMITKRSKAYHGNNEIGIIAGKGYDIKFSLREFEQLKSEKDYRVIKLNPKSELVQHGSITTEEKIKAEEAENNDTSSKENKTKS